MSEERDYAIFNTILQPILGEKLEVGKMYSSPLPGRGDSSASFIVYRGVNKPNRSAEEAKTDFTKMLFWKDWGFGEHLGHRPIHLVQHLFGLTRDEAKTRLGNLDLIEVPKSVAIKAKRALFPISDFNYTTRELQYWRRRYITADVLKHFNVGGTRYILKEGQPTFDSRQGNPTFTYWNHDGTYMIYRPEPKWLYRKPGKAFLLGYDQLPYRGRVLLLLSGMKDGLCCFTATGWSFLAAAGENDYHTYEPFMDELRSRFDYIGVCQDPDPPGQKANLLLQEKLKLPIFKFPYPDQKKDIDDLMVEYGPAKLRKAFYLKSNFT